MEVTAQMPVMNLPQLEMEEQRRALLAASEIKEKQLCILQQLIQYRSMCWIGCLRVRPFTSCYSIQVQSFESLSLHFSHPLFFITLHVSEQRNCVIKSIWISLCLPHALMKQTSHHYKQAMLTWRSWPNSIGSPCIYWVGCVSKIQLTPQYN